MAYSDNPFYDSLSLPSSRSEREKEVYKTLRKRKRRTMNRHTMLQASVPLPDKIFMDNIARHRKVPFSWVVSEALEKGLAVMMLENDRLKVLDTADRTPEPEKE